MNNKGFTLAEMLTTIVLIVIVSFLAVPGITSMLKNSEDNKYQLFKENIFLAAETYIQKHIDNYPNLKETGSTVEISLSELVNEKLVKSTLVNPKYCVGENCTHKMISTCDNEGNCVVDDYKIKVTKKEDGSYKYSLLGEGVLDDTPPTLTLTKETYVEEDFSEWSLNSNASLTEEDGKKIVTLGVDGETRGRATSKIYNVNGGFFEIIFDAFTSNETSQGIYWESYAYDANGDTALNIEGYSTNGYSYTLPLNEWLNNIRWYDETKLVQNQRWGPDVKKVKFTFLATPDINSKPPVKLRNFRIYGVELESKFYLINVRVSDESAIKTLKYAKGDKDRTYFINNGEEVRNNEIVVTENDVYTVYAKDMYGNDTISKITIDKIVR